MSNVIDIGSRNAYPANQLSNFAYHPFVFDSMRVNSMEGFLQSLKFSNIQKQREVCLLVGYNAKKAGKQQHWTKLQLLYWMGVDYQRDSMEYSRLIDRVYNALYKQCQVFRTALAATDNATLRHSIGRTLKHETVLTQNEFCGRLMFLREYKELPNDY